MVLADEQRAALEPLVEACRPRAKTPPCHLRRTVEAIIWRHKDGTTWRSIPGGLDLGGWQRSCPSTGPGLAAVPHRPAPPECVRRCGSIRPIRHKRDNKVS